MAPAIAQEVDHDVARGLQHPGEGCQALMVVVVGGDALDPRPALEQHVPGAVETPLADADSCCHCVDPRAGPPDEASGAADRGGQEEVVEDPAAAGQWPVGGQVVGQ